MRAGRVSILGLLSATALACVDGGGKSPTAPELAPPVAQSPSATVQYQISALSGSLEGTFDEGSLTFKGTARIEWKATQGTESWDFVELMPLALTREENEWSGGDVWVGAHEPDVQPVEICPALLWASTGRDPGTAMYLTQSGSSVWAEISIPGSREGFEVDSFLFGFSGTLSKGRISARLGGSYQHTATCVPM